MLMPFRNQLRSYYRHPATSLEPRHLRDSVTPALLSALGRKTATSPWFCAAAWVFSSRAVPVFIGFRPPLDLL